MEQLDSKPIFRTQLNRLLESKRLYHSIKPYNILISKYFF